MKRICQGVTNVTKGHWRSVATQAVSEPENCHGARRVRRSFCHPGTSFIDHYACRGTKLIDETELSKCNKCYKRALAQCRGTSYLGARKLSSYRRHNCEQVREFGYKIQQDLSEKQGFAKTVTSLLTLPSVLAEGVFLFRIYQVIQFNYFTTIFFVIIQHFVNFSFIITRNTI